MLPPYPGELSIHPCPRFGFVSSGNAAMMSAIDWSRQRTPRDLCKYRTEVLVDISSVGFRWQPETFPVFQQVKNGSPHRQSNVKKPIGRWDDFIDLHKYPVRDVGRNGCHFPRSLFAATVEDRKLKPRPRFTSSCIGFNVSLDHP